MINANVMYLTFHHDRCFPASTNAKLLHRCNLLFHARNCVQALQDIRLQILPILHSDAQPEHLWLHGLVAHPPPLDQRLDTAETGRVMEQMQFTREMLRHLLRVEGDTEHRAEPSSFVDDGLPPEFDAAGFLAGSSKPVK